MTRKKNGNHHPYNKSWRIDAKQLEIKSGIICKLSKVKLVGLETSKFHSFFLTEAQKPALLSFLLDFDHLEWSK